MRALLLLLLLSPVALAQERMPPREPALPPPQIDDEGVKAVVEPAPAEATPEEATVTSRVEENGDRVEEMRMNGRITMVKVTPKRGKPYYFVDSNGDGKIDRKDSDSNVAPVYFKLYEWD
jgi:hypothetical protein